MKRIAVVEDNADNRLLADALLSDHYLLTEYEDGPSAVVGLIASPPDLILLDISLPGLDGTEVLRRLRKNAALQGVPVIALTAHAMDGDRERLLDLGFDGYVSKPIVDDEALMSTIEDLLERGRV